MYICMNVYNLFSDLIHIPQFTVYSQETSNFLHHNGIQHSTFYTLHSVIMDYLMSVIQYDIINSNICIDTCNENFSFTYVEVVIFIYIKAHK